uniref:ADAMTS/ADAMTS-like cysteine-rich domain-containing protein n=1 Tax=Terrapene triunguis TaxID=2587831 RepID=A0A674J7T2_9SAUR
MAGLAPGSFLLSSLLGSTNHGPKPVNGQWAAWSEWSKCSRTCGGGVTYQERHCNNPNRIYQLCNIQPCPPNSLDFRAQQCAEFNSKPFRGWYYSWKPYTKEDRCKLYCTAEDFDFFFAMSSKVKDGTLCSQNKYDVCIDGICEQVGCDRGLGSKAALDACGVCKGDNSTCKFFKGQYLIQSRCKLKLTGRVRGEFISPLFLGYKKTMTINFP